MLNAEHSIYKTDDVEMDLSKETSIWSGGERYRCLTISDEHGSTTIALTTEQAKELAEVIQEKLKEDKE